MDQGRPFVYRPWILYQPWVYLVGLLWWLSLTPAQRRAVAQLADQQDRRRRLRVIDGTGGEPLVGPRP